MLDFQVDIQELAILLAIFLRIGLVLFLIPLFNSRQLPPQFKIGIALALSIMLYPMIRDKVEPLEFQPAVLALVVFSEFVLGLMLSLGFLLIMASFQLAGHLMSFQMGFAFAQVADPMTGAQTGVVSTFLQMFGALLFFAFDGHLFMIDTVLKSFRTVPVGGFVLTSESQAQLIEMSAYMFVVAFKIAAPILLLLLMVKLGMGLMAKFAPQMNILIVSFAITIIVGVWAMSRTVPVWFYGIREMLEHLKVFVEAVLS